MLLSERTNKRTNENLAMNITPAVCRHANKFSYSIFYKKVHFVFRIKFSLIQVDEKHACQKYLYKLRSRIILGIETVKTFYIGNKSGSTSFRMPAKRVCVSSLFAKVINK